MSKRQIGRGKRVFFHSGVLQNLAALWVDLPGQPGRHEIDAKAKTRLEYGEHFLLLPALRQAIAHQKHMLSLFVTTRRRMVNIAIKLRIRCPIRSQGQRCCFDPVFHRAMAKTGSNRNLVVGNTSDPSPNDQMSRRRRESPSALERHGSVNALICGRSNTDAPGACPLDRPGNEPGGLGFLDDTA